MKKNLKLNSNISLQALEAKALKAAAIAAEEAKTQKSQQIAQKEKKNFRKRQQPEIDREISSIFRSLQSTVSETESVMLDRPRKGLLCKAVISVYRKSDLIRQEEEEEILKRSVSAGQDRKNLPKPFRATPKVRYAFYPSTLEPNKLGSVAIYDENSSSVKARIVKSGYLFGHRVVRVSLEMGRSPYVDVTFAD